MINVTENFKKWKQYDAAFNESEAWQASLFPDARYRYFSECGCVVTSLAIMLRLYDIETQADVSKFNPWILNKKFIECGAFDSAADLKLDYINCLYNLKYTGSVPYTKNALVKAFKSGEPFLVTVPGSNAPKHFIVPERLAQGDAAVIDCASEKRHLSEYEHIFELRLFRRVPEV